MSSPHPILERKLREIAMERQAQRVQRARAVIPFLVGIALVGFSLAQPWSAVEWCWLMLGALGGGALLWLLLPLFLRNREVDFMALAREIEQTHPELRLALITALEFSADAGSTGYLQGQVLDSAVNAAVRQHWRDDLNEASAVRLRQVQTVGLVVYSCGLLFALYTALVSTQSFFAETGVETAVELKQNPDEVAILPGDVELERGGKLVVEANFKQSPPDEAFLVRRDTKGNELERLRMTSAGAEELLGAVLSSVSEDGTYLVEIPGRLASREYKITTFIYPALEQADVVIRSKQGNVEKTQELKNTTKATGKLGSELLWTMKLNKPVVSAELYADDEHILPLSQSKDDPLKMTVGWKLLESRKYRLHLVDEKERGNKQPPWFQVTALPENAPRIEVVFPKKDTRASPLQELALEAKLWAENAVQSAGLVMQWSKGEKSYPLLLKPAESATAAQPLALQIPLEELKVEPNELLNYYFWAEDTGADGKVRRSMSDMFLVEVKSFEDIYREKEAASSKPAPPSAEEVELVKLQKDVLNANWRMSRDVSAGQDLKQRKADVDAILTSQAIAEQKVTDAITKAENPKAKGAYEAAQKEMLKAIEVLGPASDLADASAITKAMQPMSQALRWLHSMSNNEKNISQSQSQKSAGQKSPEEQELAELEMKQKEQRYEEESEASEEQTAQQKENLAVLARLKELAKRQEALAEKMKEMQQKLAEAETKEEKAQLEEQLKRLQEEQQGLLSEVDELDQQMKQNGQNMAEAQQQLSQTRQEMQAAAEKMESAAELSTAVSKAEKAKQQLSAQAEDFRQRTGKQFADDMKKLRRMAQEATQQQETLGQKMEQQATADKEDASGLGQALKRGEQAREVDQQEKRVQQMLEEVKRVTEASEKSEPLLHRNLYEALRQAHSQGLTESLQEASAQTRYGDPAKARDAEAKAAQALAAVAAGVEKAADSVLGSETEGLRKAKEMLEGLAEAAAQEGKAEKPGKGQPSKDAQGKGGQAVAKNEPREQASGQGKSEGKKGAGDEPAKGGESEKSMAEAEDGKPAESGSGRGKAGQAKAKGQDSASGGSGGSTAGGYFFEEGGADFSGGAESFTAEGFRQWSDTLRNVEDLLPDAAARNELAQVMDSARDMRLESKRNNQPPQVATIQARIIQPLLELRDAVAEELARKEGKGQRNKSPIDRDPVPPRFQDMVRRYYEQLGAGEERSR